MLKHKNKVINIFMLLLYRFIVNLQHINNIYIHLFYSHIIH